MADKPLEGFGRGGRGALLLAALKNQPRRPGETSPTTEASSTTETPAEPKPLGRGAFLQSLISQSRGKVVPAQEQPKVEPEVPKIAGRGRGLGLSSILGRGTPRVQEHETSTASSTSAVPTAPVPPTPAASDDVPVSEMQELTIGKYRGTSGTPLGLEVNYVRLKVPSGKGIHEYFVSFAPAVESKRMKFRCLHDPRVKEIIGQIKTFDGSKLYLPLKLSSAVVSVTVNLPTDNSAVNVTIKYIKKCQPADCLHLYNILFKKVMTILKMTQVGRNYFDPKGGIPVPQHRLEIWPGYVTAVQEYEGGIMLNCDASFRVLRTVTAYDVMNELSRQTSNMREVVLKNLVGCVVLTRYNNKTYRVDDVEWSMNPASKFATHDGSEISFFDYYKKSYDIQIKDMKQPLLINKAKKKDLQAGADQSDKIICLVPELCFMTGLTDAMRSDFKVMKDVAVYTRITPERRQLALQNFISNVNKNPEAKNCFSAWNLELDASPLSLESRLLKSEILNFGRGAKITVSAEADWGRQVTNNCVLVPVNLDNWVIVFTKRDTPRVMEFTKMLKNCAPAMGIQVRDPIKIEILNDRTETYCSALKEAVNPTIQIVVIIFPTPRDDRYSAIKKLCCIEMPVPSQVINSKTISDARKLRSVVQKIALQINCKLGGELWSVNIPLDNFMVCGLDTYHDMSRGRRSVLAFVASINQARTRWFSMTTMQQPGQEMGDSLKMLFIASIRKYFEVNHRLPDKIVLFRDGVSDGQMEFVSKYEVEQLVSCFKHFSNDYSPSLSVVVVQKRINTRMYAVTSDQRGKSLSNPPPGSILDHTVTRKKWYDFFLVSQHVRQGTVSPTHYVVIYDTSVMKPEHMQKLAYKMTHLYYNWPGTVRVPAPCQYAHKLAYLVGQNLHKETHKDLADRLFYL
ncbi:piwi-like protein Ago3 [Uloborus diversus]|uniref:piwi-like protein Ago3 n=1 Tax=Uloborus diversus TaxID=327109 RepID=UPI002409807D|nr:piwi-like protein Ago3 [Uloborus diversus]